MSNATPHVGSQSGIKKTIGITNTPADRNSANSASCEGQVGIMYMVPGKLWINRTPVSQTSTTGTSTVTTATIRGLGRN